MKWFFYPLALLVCVTAVCQTGGSVKAGPARFYKAECGTAADYLELATDGTYRVIAREHVGVILTERGRWQQNGSVITFTPSTLMRGGKTISANGRSYDGEELEYKGKTFLSFKAEDAAGIVVPVDETKQQLDKDPLNFPLYVFFKTTAIAFVQETKQTYPFRYPKTDQSPDRK
jgi:hypothetical protein